MTNTNNILQAKLETAQRAQQTLVDTIVRHPHTYSRFYKDLEKVNQHVANLMLVRAAVAKCDEYRNGSHTQ